MKKLLLAIKVISSVIVLTGCVAQPIKVAVVDEPEEIKYENISDGKAHLYFGQDGVYQPIPLRINSSVNLGVGYETYAYITVEPGMHWVGLENKEKPVYLCKKFEENTAYFYQLEAKFGVMYPRVALNDKKVDYFEGFKQMFKTYDDNVEAKKIMVTSVKVVSENDELNKLASSIESSLYANGFSQGDELTIRLNLVAKEDGDRLARYFWGQSKEDKASVVVSASFYVNEKKVDEYNAVKELLGGVFGGSSSSLLDEMSGDLASYTSCMYSR